MDHAGPAGVATVNRLFRVLAAAGDFAFGIGLYSVAFLALCAMSARGWL